MIIEAVQKGQSLFIWQMLNENVEKCELNIKAYRKDYNEIELELRDGQSEKLEKIISHNRILNIYIPELSLSFFCELKSTVKDRRIKLFLPLEYAFHERRKHERVRPFNTYYLNLEINKSVVKKPVHDISLGGIAIVLAKTSKVTFKKGEVFSNMVLDLGHRKIKIKAEYIGSQTMDRFKSDGFPYGGEKLVFRFVEISTEDREFLASFIVQEILMTKGKVS